MRLGCCRVASDLSEHVSLRFHGPLTPCTHLLAYSRFRPQNPKPRRQTRKPDPHTLIRHIAVPTLPQYTWYGNVSYDWDYFLVGACFSLVGMLLWAVPAWLLRRYAGIRGPGISGVLRRLPGFRVITGEQMRRRPECARDRAHALASCCCSWRPV